MNTQTLSNTSQAVIDPANIDMILLVSRKLAGKWKRSMVMDYDDIAQELSLYFLQKIDKWDPAKGKLYSWLYKIGTNNLKDMLMSEHKAGLWIEIRETDLGDECTIDDLEPSYGVIETKTHNGKTYVVDDYVATRISARSERDRRRYRTKNMDTNGDMQYEQHKH
jgi:DNA-directed RNA polymerase specialized sigma24 family protein